jgi:hypothetical protein
MENSRGEVTRLKDIESAIERENTRELVHEAVGYNEVEKKGCCVSCFGFVISIVFLVKLLSE